MANRFKENEPKKEVKQASEVIAATTEKYKVLLRLDGELEPAIRQAAKAMGLPVTKYIELAVRRQLKEDGLL